MLPTSFNFRINAYIKTILSKTQENSRLKARYLKGITTEQLFIISILRDYSESSLFIQLLKINKQTRHTFYFIFTFRSHIITITIFIIDITFYFVFIHHFYLKETNIKTKGEIILTWIYRSASPPKLAFSVRVRCCKSFELDFSL
jgi:hypothetical protein